MNPISNSNWNPRNQKVVFSNLPSEDVRANYPNFLVVSTTDRGADITLDTDIIAAINLVKPHVYYTEVDGEDTDFAESIGTRVDYPDNDPEINILIGGTTETLGFVVKPECDKECCEEERCDDPDCCED
jgi:hypothetical protein